MKYSRSTTNKVESLNDVADRVLLEHKLPTLFSYRQAFIIGYNERKKRDYEIIFKGRSSLSA